jgi:hypothetical protein
MVLDEKFANDATDTLRSLGGLWIVYGIIRLIMAVFLIIFSGTATLMFGALLDRVPNPFALMADFHFVYVVMIILSVVCGILGIAGGLALMARNRSGRRFALVAAFLSLCEIPLGITLGTYTLVVLLPARAAEIHGGVRS